MKEKVKDMHIEELLDEIIETVDSGLNLKLFHRRLVEGDKIIDLSEEVRTNLPSEFESAKRITADRNKIIESAESWAANKMSSAENEAGNILESADNRAKSIVADAEERARQIVENAQMRAEQLVSENNITQVAEARAAELLQRTDEDCQARTNSAKQWSSEIVTAAYNFSMSMVGEIDSHLNGSATELRKASDNIEKVYREKSAEIVG